MATQQSYIDYVCEQIIGVGNIRYRKMFGEYMIYVNDKPVLLICDNTVYVKKITPIIDVMLENEASTGTPYNGAKEHFILDIEDESFSKKVILILEENTSLPKKKNT